MNFGRSLFQRLAELGKEKHLLNIQYRMHPSISLFPNKEFYQNKIVNAPNVEGRNYVKNYLKGSMFGSYSFVHVTDGKENFKKGHSPRNFKEAKVIDQIIAKLFKGMELKLLFISMNVLKNGKYPYCTRINIMILQRTNSTKSLSW